LRLTDDLIEDYFQFSYPDDNSKQLAERAKTFRESITSGKRNIGDYFLVKKDGIRALGSLFQQQPAAYGFSLSKKTQEIVDLPVKDLQELIQDATNRTRELKARTLTLRLVERPQFQPLLRLLTEVGFQKTQSRIEYQSEVKKLPSEHGTPLKWKPLPDLGPDNLDNAARVLQMCGQGDPDWNPEDNPRELLSSYLEDTVLSGGPECVHIGFHEDQEAAIAIAQVNPSTKWSRITYMGVVPEFRKKGYGRWVHRHGFSMMKEQGGKLYVGGTVSDNKVMQKLFLSHGCTEYLRMQEWLLRL